MTCKISPLSDHTGAAARGVDLSRPVDAETRRRLNRAFVESSVLVIRGQSLTASQLLDGVKLFGDVFQQHNSRFALPECPPIHYLSNQDRSNAGTRSRPGAGYHSHTSHHPPPPTAPGPRP